MASLCGLVGIWRKRTPVGDNDLRDVSRMMAAIEARGPDGSGQWHCNRLALGHRRLAIIDDTPRGAQPMVTADGKGVIAFNGEIYNYRELRRTLEREGASFVSETDTEVLLAALHFWGPDRAVPLLNGMFAFAYFDARTDTLWLSRDRLGVKSLSVLETADGVVFGSEDKAILACADVSRKVSTREIMLRLAWQNRDSLSSLFEGIERLQPGSIWRIAGDTVEKRTYWDPLAALDIGRLSSQKGSASELGERLEALLTESVRMHGVSDTRIAAACSGGVDSSLIAVLAKRDRPDLHAYVVDPQIGDSEAGSAARVARQAGIELRRVPIDREKYMELWPKAIWFLESDGWQRSLAGLLAMCEQCRSDGVKVLLTGEGSDELFGGYKLQRDSMSAWRRVGWPATLVLSRARWKRRFEILRNAPYTSSLGFLNSPLRNIFFVMSPDANFLQKRIFDRLEGAGSFRDRAFIGACIFDLYSHLQDLLHRKDRLAMGASVELRVPFIENALIDFALHLPRRMRLRGGHGKWLLKKVATRHIPAENIWARKKGFPMSDDFTVGAEALLRKGLLAQHLDWSAGAVEDLIDLAARQASTRQRLVGMELFLRLFAGGESPGALSDRLLSASSRGA